MSAKKQQKPQPKQTKAALLQVVLALIFTYIFGSFAIDSGSLWHYLLAFISFGVAVNGAGQLRKQ